MALSGLDTHSFKKYVLSMFYILSPKLGAIGDAKMVKM